MLPITDQAKKKPRIERRIRVIIGRAQLRWVMRTLHIVEHMWLAATLLTTAKQWLLYQLRWWD